MSSGYEWAASTEAFLAATSGRRGFIQPCSMESHLVVPVKPFPIEMHVDMEVFAAQEFKIAISKRKLVDEMDCIKYKRVRLHW